MLTWLVFHACAAPAPATDPDTTGATSTSTGVPYGRWKGEQVCLELFHNGDLEISLPLAHPKQLVLGRFEAAAESETTRLQVDVARIWRGRYVSRCREVHEPGHWAESAEVLGIEVKPGQRASFTVRRRGSEALELCGAQCVELERDEPLLTGRWRRVGLESPMQPGSSAEPGMLAEVALRDERSHLWLGDGKALATVDGKTQVHPDGADRFRVVFVPGPRFTGAARVFDAALVAGTPVELQGRRLPGHQLELCRAKQCATLERQMESDHYDLD